MTRHSKYTKRENRAWEVYKTEYHKQIKGHSGWYSKRYTKKEFMEQYDLAKKATISNPAKAVAISQRLVEKRFENRYKKLFGEDALKNVRDPDVRRNLFDDTIAKMKELGMDTTDEHQAFEDYYGY